MQALSCRYLREGDKAVGALADASVIDEYLILVLRLVEGAFGGHGSQCAIGLCKQVLIGVVALFQRDDCLVGLALAVVFHEVALG